MTLSMLNIFMAGALLPLTIMSYIDFIEDGDYEKKMTCLKCSVAMFLNLLVVVLPW